MYIESDLTQPLMKYLMWRTHTGSCELPETTDELRRRSEELPAAYRQCGQRDWRWTIVSWSFIIWQFVRVAALLPRLSLHRMAPTNVIPHNSSGTGNVCVVSAVSFSPWMCIHVAHEAARWWLNNVCLFGRLRQLVISSELRWRCAKRSDKGECESSASGGTFHQLN